jgi:hypothetical protein
MATLMRALRAIEKAGSVDPDKIKDELAKTVIELPSDEINIILPYDKIDLTKDGGRTPTSLFAQLK